jgi:hypothetical protein
MAQPTAGMQYSAFQKKSNSMQNHYGMKQETHFQQQQHNGTELPINHNGMQPVIFQQNHYHFNSSDGQPLILLVS